MRRLTEFAIPETGFFALSEDKYKRIMMDEKPSVEEVYNRLKKIEDILGSDYDLDHLRALAQADREGRCVVLPCKVGDTVYRVVTPTPDPPLLSEMKITTMKQAASLVNLVGKHKLVSYYLTREEAEAALREEEK